MDGIKTVSDIFDIPYDTADGVARVTVFGEREAYVENFISLLEYKKDNIKLKCKSSVVVISGAELKIKAIKENSIMVSGRIEAIKFI